MPAILQGYGIRVEVGLTEGSPIAVTAISKASPGVATTGTAHSYVNGDAAFFDNVLGMEEVSGQIVRVASASGSTFTLEGRDTTDHNTFVSGFVIKVASWATLAFCQEVDITGGARRTQDGTVLLNTKENQIYGIPGQQEVTFNGLSDMRSAAMARVQQLARTKLAFPIPFRITSPQGEVRLFRANCSQASERWASNGALTTSSFSGLLIGDYMAYGA